MAIFHNRRAFLLSLSHPKPLKTSRDIDAPGSSLWAGRPLLYDAVITSTRAQLYILITVIFFALSLLAGKEVASVFLYPSLIAGLLVSLVMPGYLLLKLLDIARNRLSETILFSVGTSLFLLLLTGLLLNTLVPLFGVETPLSTLPLAALVITLNLSLLFLCNGLERDLSVRVKIPRVSGRLALAYLIPPLFAVASIMGAVSLNNGGSNWLAMAVLFGIGVYSLLALVYRKSLPGSVFPFALFFMALAVMLSISLRGWIISGHDILYEFGVFQMTKGYAHWSIDYYRDAYNACLSITLLPTMLSGLMPKAPDELIFRVLFQAIFALTPVALYRFLRNYLSRSFAFVACLFFIAQPPLLQDFAFLTRQEIALFFNLMVLLAFASRSLTRFQRYFLAVAFGMSMIWSHYSTTYIAVVLFFLVLIIRNRFTAGVLSRLNRLGRTFTAPVVARLPLRQRQMTPETIAGITRDANAGKNIRWLPGWVFVLSLLALTMAWNIGITGTHNNFTGFVGAVYKTVTGQTNLSEYKSGLADQLKIYSKSVEQTDTMDAFVASRQGGVHTTELARYTADTYKDYSPRIDTPVTLSPENATISQAVYSGGEIYKKFAKAFLLLGALWLIFSRLGSLMVDDDFKGLMVVSIFVLGMALMVPFFSEEYSLMRAYQQLLASLSLPAVIGAFLTFNFFIKKYVIYFTAAFFIIYFLLLSSFLPQLLGFGYAQLNLNNYGVYYDIHYTHESETQSINWLANNADPEVPTYTDFYAKKKFEVFSPRSMWVVDNVLPENINREAYVYADYTNKGRETAYVPFAGTELNYRFPMEFLDREKDVIYSNGETEILK